MSNNITARKVQCEYCDESFHRSGMASHIRNKHPDKRGAQPAFDFLDEHVPNIDRVNVDHISAEDCLSEMWKVVQDILFFVRQIIDVLFNYIMAVAGAVVFLRQTGFGG